MHSGRDMRDDHRAVPAAARRALPAETTAPSGAASAGGKDLTGRGHCPPALLQTGLCQVQTSLPSVKN